MLAKERHTHILQVLDRNGALRTTDIAQKTGVTDETIRRDLETLHKDGLLVRTHGGAISRNHPGRNLSFQEREVIHLDEKIAIAREAEQFLSPRDVIFIDGSSTALQLAKRLPSLDITVITNAHAVIDALAGKEGVEVISTGGRYDSDNRCYCGALAYNALSRYRIQTAFFSANGIDTRRGLSESNEAYSDMKAAALNVAEKKVFLADSSKVGVCSTFFFSRLDQIDVWVTDWALPRAHIEEFRQYIPRLEIADKSVKEGYFQ